MANLKVGMIQMSVVFGEAQTNIKRADELIAEAVAQGAQICVLPECMDLGWANPDAGRLAYPIPGKTSDAYCEIARKNHVWLVAGITEKSGDDVYNAALLISDKGEILHRHRKINVLTGVEDVYAIGDAIAVTGTPFGTIGIDICADNAVQSLSIGHTLARMGAQVILSPSAWAVQPDRDPVKEPYGNEWHVPYRQLSELFEIPVIGVSNVGSMPAGTWAGWKAIGNSIAYNSNGQLETVLPYGEDAECVRVIEVALTERKRSGTELSEYTYSFFDK